MSRAIAIIYSFTQLVKKYPFFMEPVGSLLCSQKPTIGPYPKPAKSSLLYQSLSP